MRRRFRLRTKAILTLVIAFFALGLGLHWTISRILLNAFAQTESNEVREELARSQRALFNIREEMLSRARDWGEWDELFRFVEDRNEDFIRANCDINSMNTLHIDMLAIVHRSGRIVWAQMTDEEHRALLPMPEEFVYRFWPGGGFLKEPGKDIPAGGMISLPVGPLVFASAPIRAGNHTGSSRGTLIFGRLLNASHLGEYSRQSSLRMSVHTLDRAGIPPDAAAAMKTLISPLAGPNLVQVLSADTIAGYRMLPDINGLPALLVKVELERGIHHQALLALDYLRASLFAFALVCALVTMVVLERLVLLRLTQVGRQLRDIGIRGDSSMRVDLGGGDELAELATDINATLASVWRAESALRVTKFSLDHAADPIHWVAKDGRFVYANEAACRALGCSVDDLLQMSVFDIDPSMDPERWATVWRELDQQCAMSLESVNRTRDGRLFPVEITGTLVEFENQSCICASVRDITERKQTDSQLRQAALHDPLTGLANRSLLEQHLGKAIERARRVPDYAFAVMFLDFDRFKVINDSLGHQIGDQLLVAISRRLQASVRAVDVVSCTPTGQVARLGGDEFVILLDGIHGINDAVLVADRLQEELAEAFVLGGHQVHVTVSIGIVSSELGYSSPNEMLRDADTAMYHAKAAGKARHVVFDRHMHDQAMARLEMEANLRGAIERHEFQVVYQPIVALESGALEGFEALARWVHGQRGLIPAHEFIPIATETGLILSLGRMMVLDACAQLKAFAEIRREGEPLIMSINVSEQELLHPDLLPTLKTVLHTTGIPAESLRMEIAENIIVEQATDVLPVLAEIKNLGLRVCMVDFGRGRSSLSSLHHFPIDYLKIGREFISNLGATDSGLNLEYTAIVQALVTLAHNLDIRVIAVGVESADQLTQLQAMSCDFAQGYHLAHPLSSEEAAALMQQTCGLLPWAANAGGRE